MSRILSWAAPALIATALVAQQAPPTSQPPAASGTAAERFAALQAEQKKLIADWRAKAEEAQAKAKAAQAAGQPVPAMPMRPDFGPVVEQAMAAAKDHAGTADAVQFLTFVVQNGMPKSEAMVAAIDTLTDKHVQDAAIAGLGSRIAYLSHFVGAEAAPRMLERLAKSDNADVRGWATIARTQKAIERAEFTSAAYKTAKADMEKAAEAAEDKQLKDQIREAIETREKHGAGTTAPDIEGTDLDGVQFKLSDYRGKVVFLDFWGDW